LTCVCHFINFLCFCAVELSRCFIWTKPFLATVCKQPKIKGCVIFGKQDLGLTFPCMLLFHVSILTAITTFMWLCIDPQHGIAGMFIDLDWSCMDWNCWLHILGKLTYLRLTISGPCAEFLMCMACVALWLWFGWSNQEYLEKNQDAAWPWEFLGFMLSTWSNTLSDILAKARLELYEHSYSVTLKCSCAVLFAITKYYSMHR